MSGWIWARDAVGASPRIDRFSRVFGVSGVPALSLRPLGRDHGDPCAWMWRTQPDWADLDYAEADGISLLLDGYLTGGGCHGEPPVKGAAAWLLSLWQQHGDSLLPELNGSFSLSINDTGHGIVTLVADRWSSRPLWYAREGDALLAANNASAVAALLNETPRLDPAGAWSLLAGNRPVGTHGLYAGVQRVAAGCLVRLDADQNVDPQRWFRLRYEPDHDRSAAQWGADIAAALRESAAAIRRHGNVNLFLSGGLDSRIAAGAFGSDISSTTIVSSRNLSAEIAERVAAAAGSRQVTLLRDDNWYLDTFDASALMSGGAYNVHHAHFFQALERLQVESGEHFVLGDLAENFNEHYWKFDENVARAMSPDGVIDAYSVMDKYAHKTPSQLQRLFAPGVADSLEAAWQEAYRPVVDECFGVSDDPRDALDALFRWYDNYFCPTNLMLECLKPVGGHANLMFDNRLLDLLCAVPADIKSSGVLHKKILRNLDPKLLWIPNSNFWLPPAFPAWMERANRGLRRSLRPLRDALRKPPPASASGGTKSPGSWHVMYRWYWNDPGHRQFLHDLIEDPQALPDEIFDRQALRDSVAAFEGGDVKRHYELYPLISFGLLHRQLPATGL